MSFNLVCNECGTKLDYPFVHNAGAEAQHSKDQCIAALKQQLEGSRAASLLAKPLSPNSPWGRQGDWFTTTPTVKLDNKTTAPQPGPGREVGDLSAELSNLAERAIDWLEGNRG